MPCSICKNDLPSNNYALEEGVFLCLPCFLERHGSRDLTQIPCQSCGALPSMTHRIISDYPREKSRSSVNETQSRHISESSTAESSYRLPYPSRSYESNNRQLSRSSEKRKQTCQVCFDEKPSRHFRSISNHKCHQLNRSICDECIYQHIHQAFQNILTDDVRCPELDCGIKYEYDTIKNILHSNDNIKLFNRYDQFLVRLHLEQMDEFIWCSNPKCAMGQLNDGGDSNNIVTCIRCRQKTCFTHKIAWHQGLTCEGYDLTIDNNLQSSLQWITQNTKECPNCHFRIEKNDGCDHMTCIKCQYEFCWSCLADFDRIRKDGNHRHDPNCKHYAAYDKI